MEGLDKGQFPKEGVSFQWLAGDPRRAPQPCYPRLLQGLINSGQGVSLSVGLELVDRMMKAGLARDQRERRGQCCPVLSGNPNSPCKPSFYFVPATGEEGRLLEDRALYLLKGVKAGVQESLPKAGPWGFGREPGGQVPEDTGRAHKSLSQKKAVG